MLDAHVAAHARLRRDAASRRLRCAYQQCGTLLRVKGAKAYRVCASRWALSVSARAS